MGFELKNKEVICAKMHVCGWCGEWIDIGEKAQYRVYKWEGDFVDGHEHPECYQAMLTLDYRDAQEGWMPGDYKRGSTEWA